MRHLQVGDTITVRYSKKLDSNGNGALANHQGVVTRILVSGGQILGVWAEVKLPRRSKKAYIPANSIEGSEEINRARVINILKSTVL